jgi:hypothetical protein
MLFLILLLPLRGWAVDGMALHLGFAGSEVTVEALQRSSLAMPDDCPMLSHDTHSQTSPSSAANDHNGCQLCELCMPLAALESQNTIVVASHPNAVPATPAPTFASAETARLSKPPIS